MEEETTIEKYLTFLKVLAIKTRNAKGKFNIKQLCEDFHVNRGLPTTLRNMGLIDRDTNKWDFDVEVTAELAEKVRVANSVKSKKNNTKQSVNVKDVKSEPFEFLLAKKRLEISFQEKRDLIDWRNNLTAGIKLLNDKLDKIIQLWS